MVQMSSKWGNFEVEFNLEGQGQSLHKTIGILTKVFTPLNQIWWFSLERVMSYCADKQVIDTHTDTHTHMDSGIDSTRMPKLASGKYSRCYWLCIS